jgi:hypothetical protein
MPLLLLSVEDAVQMQDVALGRLYVLFYPRLFVARILIIPAMNAVHG